MIYQAVFEKLRFEEKIKEVLALNISENGRIILPKELSRHIQNQPKRTYKFS